MIFKHRVKRNGVYYEAGQDVPMENEKKENITPAENTSNEESVENINDMSGLEENIPKRGRPKKTE